MADQIAPILHVSRPSGEKRLGVVRRLYPGYFALVMATGIVSTGLYDIGWSTMSGLLLIIGAICLVVLLAATAIRVAVFPREVAADLSAPDRAYAFFTFVAACTVIGARSAGAGLPSVACVLGGIAFLAWMGLSYGIPVRLVLGPRPQPVLAGVNGTWFIWVVGTQSLAVISAVLGTAYRGHAEFVHFAGLTAVLMWSVGVVLYLMVATLVLTRLLLLEVRPEDLTPPYWVTMGATAITVLAAAEILAMPVTPATGAARPVLAGLGIVLWAFGTWLIPMLVLFGLWRHVLRRTRLEYLPQLWSIVFPLGMYATASMELGRAVGLPIIEEIGRTWVWVAFPAWAVTFTAMIVKLLVTLSARVTPRLAQRMRPRAARSDS
ncbi:tellurite resistance/C4-dicarboxylate transporter family protein [Sphaerimonospora thailandensis]|uniref:Tellurite resistance protein permease n=1 Tax=Sphaerimonospora thailandensis TaxID=795644 RepID=A0A8J3RF84_9ACTN|nr:tellurite resistance/C4-dicarboxylate transporter family protein [Sphaerimonospora thailandensis]GIH73176.1 tellurite resistance protein permease [Sphaerimonospora thailandensis]